MIKLELTIDEVNLLLVALSKLPLETSLVTWSKLKQEAEKQLKEGVEAKKE